MSVPVVGLVELDDAALARLVAHAVPGAEIGEVMPHGPGPDTWTPRRLAEFVAFHRGRRGGLDGPAAELSWAIVVDGAAAGVVRLQRVGTRCWEVGLWLTRSARGRGVTHRVLCEVVQKATALGARTVVAHTSNTNGAALAALARIGATFDAPDSQGRVRVVLDVANV